MAFLPPRSFPPHPCCVSLMLLERIDRNPLCARRCARCGPLGETGPKIGDCNPVQRDDLEMEAGLPAAPVGRGVVIWEGQDEL